MKMNKKGFTLVELVVSITLLSIVLVFLMETLVILKKDETSLGIETELAVNQAIISKKINSDVALNNLESLSCTFFECTFTFGENNVKTLKLLTDENNKKRTLEYGTSDKIDFKRTLPEDIEYSKISFSEWDTGEYGILKNIKIDIYGYSDYGIEIVDY